MKAIIFDLDDTLYNEFDFVKTGFLAVCDLLSVATKKSSAVLYDTLITLFEKHGRDRLFDEMLRQYPCSLSVIDLVNCYRTHKRELTLFPEVKSVLDTLSKHYFTGLITDGCEASQKTKIASLDISQYFKKIIVTDSLGASYWKPHAKAFQLMQQAADCHFFEMVYIGDNPFKDFLTPKQLSMKTIRINRGNLTYSNERHLLGSVDLEIDNLKQLQNILEKGW